MRGKAKEGWGRKGKRGIDKARQGRSRQAWQLKKVVGQGRQHMGEVGEVRQGMGRVGKAKLVEPRQHKMYFFSGWSSPIRGLCAEVLGHRDLVQGRLVRIVLTHTLESFQTKPAHRGKIATKS